MAEIKKEEKRINRFDDKELSIIKNTFRDNEDALKLLRKIFLQLPLSALDEAVYINTFKGKEDLMKILRKTYLPQLDGDAPFSQVIDLWMTVDLKEKNLEEAMLIFKSRQLLIEYVEQQLNKIENFDTDEAIKLSDMIAFQDKMPDSAFIDLITRNTIIWHTEQQILMYNLMASQVEEDEATIKEKNAKNSNK